MIVLDWTKPSAMVSFPCPSADQAKGHADPGAAHMASMDGHLGSEYCRTGTGGRAQRKM
jgi:hypothetical protein